MDVVFWLWEVWTRPFIWLGRNGSIESSILIAVLEGILLNVDWVAYSIY